MCSTEMPIENAFRSLKSEIEKRSIEDVSLKIDGPEWLSIKLSKENRFLWIGYKKHSGYFLSWDKNLPSGPFFELDEQGLSLVLSVVPNHTDSFDATNEDFDRNFKISSENLS